MPLSRKCCATLGRIIGALALAAALAACSTVKLAYNNLPEISYWWLDDYVDFDDAQTPRVRDELRQLLAWHRREELPKLAALLQRMQALAPDDVTPAQACELVDAFRVRLLAVAERVEPAAAELARSLDAAQLAQLERKYHKLNDKYREDWLARSPEQQRDKRYEQLLDRSEDFYGRLDAAQREWLREQVGPPAFDPVEIDGERRKRQQETLALLRGLRADGQGAEQARAEVHAYVMRIGTPPPGPARERQRAMQQEACRTFAALHNQTTAAQREKAVRRLQGYEGDLQQLSGQPS
ncbi:DUF6279 family lipoprotein [Variovorax sp. J22P168]|uniref:DUF6279 family lipoprotein n=1 Tax=Variovorax jilinensis TaxID=3053513 RepID=UPI0025766880|nr:DUF6279 family lipoprotein [Variovorax sp. J22P168]MDM0011272.1 DUF6279 family lipoprotein [Variovorax sp. J22P168]